MKFYFILFYVKLLSTNRTTALCLDHTKLRRTHKKSARNLNMSNFCHSPKKLAAVSPINLGVIARGISFEKSLK
jgi:hypothetical protein